MRTIKYLIFIILTTFSVQSFADYKVATFTASTASEACALYYSSIKLSYDSINTSAIEQSGNKYCYYSKGADKALQNGEIYYVASSCSSSEYFDVKGPQFYAGDTYCKNKCVRSVVPLNSYDFSTGGAITVDGMCNDSFTSCSGVSKNTGASCSADTSGWSDTSRGTAPPVDPKCKNYGTFNGQTVCVDSTQKGKAASSTNATGTGSGTGVGTTTSTNSDGSQTTVTRNADGSSTTTITRADGSKITIVASADGSSVTTSTTSTNTSNQPSTTTTTSTSTTTTSSTKNLDGTTVSVSTNTSGGSTGGTRGTSVSGGSSDSSGEGTTTSGGGDSGGGDDGGDGGDDGGGGNGVDLSGVIAAINAAKSAIVSAVDKVTEGVKALGDKLDELKDWLTDEPTLDQDSELQVHEEEITGFQQGNHVVFGSYCPFVATTREIPVAPGYSMTFTDDLTFICEWGYKANPYIQLLGHLGALIFLLYGVRSKD